MTETKVARAATRVDWVVAGLLLLSLTGNVFLTLRLMRVPAMPVVSARASERPVPGVHVSDFQAADLSGVTQTISYKADKRPVVLYIFSPACIWCARNLPNVRALVKSRSDRFRFVGVSLDPDRPKVAAYIQASGFTAPVVLNPSIAMALEYGLGATPKTIVIDSGGTVVKTWSGAYSASAARDVESYFGVSLPGLAEVSPEALAKLSAPSATTTTAPATAK